MQSSAHKMTVWSTFCRTWKMSCSWIRGQFCCDQKQLPQRWMTTRLFSHGNVTLLLWRDWATDHWGLILCCAIDTWRVIYRQCCITTSCLSRTVWRIHKQTVGKNFASLWLHGRKNSQTYMILMLHTHIWCTLVNSRLTLCKMWPVLLWNVACVAWQHLRLGRNDQIMLLSTEQCLQVLSCV